MYYIHRWRHHFESGIRE